MAINTEVTRNATESGLSVLRRFTKRVQGAGILPRVRSLRYNLRVLSHYKTKMRTLEVIAHRAQTAELVKQGKVSEEKRERR